MSRRCNIEVQLAGKNKLDVWQFQNQCMSSNIICTPFPKQISFFFHFMSLWGHTLALKQPSDNPAATGQKQHNPNRVTSADAQVFSSRAPESGVESGTSEMTPPAESSLTFVCRPI